MKRKPRVVIVNRARSEQQQQAQAHYAKMHSAKLIASFRKPKPPAESWWALPQDRAQFYVRAEQEYRERLVGFGVSEANTF